MDMQLVNGRRMLLKYVFSYVTKMHDAATAEGLYSRGVMGYQVANSFLRTVHPLAPEIFFQLSNVKMAYTEKLTKQFCLTHPSQEHTNVIYQLYLCRGCTEEHQCFLHSLRSHSTVGNKPEDLGPGKYLVAIKYILLFNAVFFFQHLLVHHPYHHAMHPRHLAECTIPPAIQFFDQAMTSRFNLRTGQPQTKSFNSSTLRVIAPAT